MKKLLLASALIASAATSVSAGSLSAVSTVVERPGVKESLVHPGCMIRPVYGNDADMEPNYWVYVDPSCRPADTGGDDDNDVAKGPSEGPNEGPVTD